MPSCHLLQRGQQLIADTLSTVLTDYADGDLGNVVADEAIRGVVGREVAIPSGAEAAATISLGDDP